ncbi:CUE domain-containing protein 3 [Psilocybe cubensis]|uniref:CUE domain-containing protein 3 n=2 Tax=Psilocybe cubensis TaxID=181762 RepID=A0ACB8GSP3_PSICU|nr:CUE domain-containing protein 3 [Psilocybe cubensis]KAH9478377.1 CUE domain-containing protein 3 [Psilocybe cubensis]
MTNDVLRLPNYPSTQSRKGLSPSQLATLYQTIASTLNSVLELPANKRDTPSSRNFLATYASDTAFQNLQNLIWIQDSTDTSHQIQGSATEKFIQKKVLVLAEKLASTTPGLDVRCLLDLSVIYCRSQPSRLRLVFKSAFESEPSLAQIITDDLVPGFASLLSQQTSTSQGLYAQRKIAECMFGFLRGAKGTPELIRPFAHSKPLLLALATTYDIGMTTIAASYGGISALTAGIAAQGRDADDWERIWVETKVALLDSFHVILTTLLDDLASCAPGPRLAFEAERTFDLIFALLDAPSSSSSTASDTPTPFLDQSLLADYQQAYSLSNTLAAALKHAQEKDARLDLLESTLRSYDHESASGVNGQKGRKNAGALKILLRSSGIQPGIDNLGTRNATTRQQVTEPIRHPIVLDHGTSKAKGKSRAAAPLSDPDLDIKATQVLDILPDTPVDYVKLLLAHDRYGRNPEKVIEALLEGTAMSREQLEEDLQAAADLDYGAGNGHSEPVRDDTYKVEQRRNVFDDDVLDLTQLRFGKKSAGDEILRDRTFIEDMKADILRRAEAISDDEEEEGLDSFGKPLPVAANSKGKGKAIDSSGAIDLGPDEDEEDVIGLRVAGDGEDSDNSEAEDDEQEEEQTPESIIEQAYLRDPKVFERDAATRRSKARMDLKTQTGWADEQIEGWKVMLDRNPGRKDKLAEKYAFRGNEKGLDVRPGGSDGGRGRGGPRGRGRGRGGGGRGGRSGAGGESSAKERAWKDKNKASRANHNRKRGHDKKMARAGAGPST